MTDYSDTRQDNTGNITASEINRAFEAQAFVVDRPWGDGDWVVLGSPDPHQATIVLPVVVVLALTRTDDGQHEVWKVVAQQQEPNARAQERRRWARVLDKVAADHLAVATEKREQAMEAHGEGDDHTYRKRMDSGGTHKTLADTYHRIARRIEANDAR